MSPHAAMRPPISRPANRAAGSPANNAMGSPISRASAHAPETAARNAAPAIAAAAAPPTPFPMARALAAVFAAQGASAHPAQSAPPAHSAYIVGGTVRDALLGRPISDIDIAIDSGNADAAARALAAAVGGRYVRLHQDWQAARVMLPDGAPLPHIDITAADGGGGIARDLARRDFTMNAIALPIAAAAAPDWRAHVIDPTGGVRDIRARVVRMTSPAALDADPLRLMRAARLASALNFGIDADTAAAVKARAQCAAAAAPERVRQELMLMMQGPGARAAVRLMDSLGLLCAVIPELAQSKGVAQPKEHYYDVFNHLVECVGWAERVIAPPNPDRPKERPDAVLSIVPRFAGFAAHWREHVSDGFDRAAYLNLAALLHDVAKPATKTIEPSGRIRFIGHHAEGADIARDILARLRFGKRGAEHIAAMVHHHLRPRQMAQDGAMPSGRALYRYYRDVGGAALDTLYLNAADYLAARGPALDMDDWARHCALMRHIADDRGREKSPQAMARLITGYDIMDKFALQPSPAIGRLLEKARLAQASGHITTKTEALALVAASLECGGDGA